MLVMAVCYTKYDFVTKEKVDYINIPAAFDIETTSYTYDGGYSAFMYSWGLKVGNSDCKCGRTWGELREYLSTIKVKYRLTDKKRLVIYVHNLPFEYQFFKHEIEIIGAFYLKERSPVVIVTDGIEWRCSYALSGKSLEKLGQDLGFKKLVGNLDYSLIRTSITPLTEDEMKYQIRDVEIVCEYIKSQIKLNGNITKIPLTKTGYVRRQIRDSMNFATNEMIKVKNETLTPRLYMALRCAFCGGFTHASWKNSGRTLRNVGSFDLTSAYPAAMVYGYFPGKFIHLKEPNEDLVKNMCCLLRVNMKEIISIGADSILSRSKMLKAEGVEEDNGRIFYAREVEFWTTEIDLSHIKKMYDIGHYEIDEMYVAPRNHLPAHFIMEIMQLYKKKTEYKGVFGKEIEYMLSKENINSSYGMTVMDICRKKTIWVNDRECTLPKDEEYVKECIDSYNEDKKRFLSYAWGVWVTAHVRDRLWRVIEEVGSDHVYSDTDSDKILHYEKYMSFIENENKMITNGVHKTLEQIGIPTELASPCDIHGVKHPLGEWEFEGVYDEFKTLGAKRYVYKKNGELNITIAGVNKKKGGKWLTSNGGFDAFHDGMIIPADYAGRNVKRYIDDEWSGVVTDYLGNECVVSSLSGVHLSSSSYHLGCINEFDVLMGILGREDIESEKS